MNRLLVTVCLIVLATLPIANAQTAPTIEELQQRISMLESRLNASTNPDVARELEELKRQIDVLAREIERAKVERGRPAEADQQQYGLGAAASKVYRAGEGVSFGGYGEFLYENYASERDDEVASGRTDQLDVLRAILYTGYKFSDRVIFNSEIEFEHASTGAGGEVSVEFAYLDFMINPAFNIRAGQVLVPSGLVNELHEPTAFFGAKRPDVERAIIPSTWRDPGVGIFGEIGPVTYRTYLLTGLRSDKFTASGIRSGRQQGARAQAEDFGIIARADWNIAPSLLVGGSYYTGDSAQGRKTPTGESFDANVRIAEVHADARFRGLALRALWADGSIGDAKQVNLANALTGNKSIGEEFGGWYVEAGYDLASILPLGSATVAPFVRLEEFNSQEAVPSGYALNPALDNEVLTIGINYKPIPQAVVKFDFQNYDNAAGTGVDQFNLALGYIF